MNYIISKPLRCARTRTRIYIHGCFLLRSLSQNRLAFLHGIEMVKLDWPIELLHRSRARPANFDPIYCLGRAQPDVRLQWICSETAAARHRSIAVANAS